MCYLVEKFGSLELEEILEPAIKYAEGGFILDLYVAKTIAFNMYIISKFPETAKILLKDGFPPNPWGDARWDSDFDTLVQKDLAKTLRNIADVGPDAFYKGDIASFIAEDMELNNGYIQKMT